MACISKNLPYLQCLKAHQEGVEAKNLSEWIEEQKTGPSQAQPQINLNLLGEASNKSHINTQKEQDEESKFEESKGNGKSRFF
jgi:hypothetical protein